MPRASYNYKLNNTAFFTHNNKSFDKRFVFLRNVETSSDKPAAQIDAFFQAASLMPGATRQDTPTSPQSKRNNEKYARLTPEYTAADRF